MDGAQAAAGFNRDALAGVTPALKGLVDQQAQSGIVSLVWRRGNIRSPWCSAAPMPACRRR